MSKRAREPAGAKLNLPNLLGIHVDSISQCIAMDNIRTIEGSKEVDVNNNGFVQEFHLSLNI